MDLRADLLSDSTPRAIFEWIDDLGRYPQWMGLVHRAATIDAIDGFPAWSVDLTARIGPFARSKRLTMVRTVCDPSRKVIFERREGDGRLHSMWRLSATVAESTKGSLMEMELHYGGGQWTAGIVERVLYDEINRSRTRLANLLDEPTHSSDRQRDAQA